MEGNACCGMKHRLVDRTADYNTGSRSEGNLGWCNCNCSICDPRSNYRGKVLEVGETHSFEDGFNGKFGVYRIERIREALQLLPDCGNVLELGCGEGRITEFLVTRFERVVAVEPSPKPLEIARRRVQDNNIDFFNGFAEDYDTGEKFDCVVATGVLEHVQNVEKFLSVVKKALKPNGIFILTVPNAASLHRRIGLKMGLIQSLNELGSLDARVGHYRYYDFGSLINELSANGLSIFSLKGILLKALPFGDLEKLSEEYLNGCFALGNELPELCAEIFCIAKRML